MKKTFAILLLLTLLILISCSDNGNGDMTIRRIDIGRKLTGVTSLPGNTHFYRLSVSTNTNYYIELSELDSNFKWSIWTYISDNSGDYLTVSSITSRNQFADNSTESNTIPLISGDYLLVIDELRDNGNSKYDLLVTMP